MTNELRYEMGIIDEIPDVESDTGTASYTAVTLNDIKQGSDADELIKHRFLCRGGGMLLAGPTGAGKSSLSTQMALSWALGRGCFGLHPSKPLRSLIVQAENDDGDLFEMTRGVAGGLNFSTGDASAAFGQISVACVDDVCGLEFFTKALQPLMEKHKPDLLWIDPLLAYLGGDVSRQEVCGLWLRKGLNPLLHAHQCAGIIVHHTNKPPSGKEKPDWAGSDFAYVGAGSAELANWPRAVIALRGTKSNDVFELRLGKRGGRAGWTEPDGITKAYAKYISHSRETGRICWHEIDADSVDTGHQGRPVRHTVDELTALLKSELTTKEWQQRAEDETGMRRAKFYELKKMAVDQEKVFETLKGKWAKKP